MTHSVSDFIIRIKNASFARRQEIIIPYANINKQIGNVLKKEGFISGLKEAESEGRKKLKIVLRYEKRKPVITNVSVISKPSLRVYIPHQKVDKIGSRIMTSVLSTSKGVMTGKEALKQGVGGELLFTIW